MVFSSAIFLFGFLPAVLMIYFVIRKEFRNAFLFLASSAFYFWGEQKMLLLMYFVILLNYGVSLHLEYLEDCKEKPNANTNNLQRLRKAILILCVLICVSLLWYYKYWNFSISIFNKIALALGFSYKLSFVDKIVLPLGISFYTFHVLSYTFDVYYGKMRADKNVLNFMTYVLMFPQLVAGPIVRYIDIQKQFEERTVTAVGFANGIRRFCFGLGKKILIANTVAKVVDKIFALPIEQIDVFTAWIGAICYTLQIYFDFSGYSDMAIGLAAMFGFHYKENFNYPYIAKSVSDFWRRWHISLSTWLRDYVYIHLGGSKEGKYKYYCNVLLVFLLSGLWHGANMTFVLWGVWYGVFIVLESIFLKKFLQGKTVLTHLYMLAVIIFGWVLFRAPGVRYAGAYWLAMFGKNGVNMDGISLYLANDVLLAILLGIFFSMDWRTQYKNFVIKERWLPYKQRFYMFKLLSYATALCLFVLSVMSVISSSYNPFIYFRF